MVIEMIVMIDIDDDNNNDDIDIDDSDGEWIMIMMIGFDEHDDGDKDDVRKSFMTNSHYCILIMIINVSIRFTWKAQYNDNDIA